jgi:hypothetical protein
MKKAVLLIVIVAAAAVWLWSDGRTASADCQNAQAAVDDDPRNAVFLEWQAKACGAE